MTTLECTLIATLKDIRYTLDLAQMGYEINTTALIKIVDETLQTVETAYPEITESPRHKKNRNRTKTLRTNKCELTLCSLTGLINLQS